MITVYDQHDAAFRQVSAFVVVAKGGERVATVAIKFPKDGAGRLWAYVHWVGARMERGYADGYGYDKRSAAAAAAAAAAIRKINPNTLRERKADPALNAFVGAALEMDGQDWTRALEKAGFTVWQAV